MHAILVRMSTNDSKPARAFSYVRLSVETERSTSPGRQLEECRRVIEARGWQEVAVFSDLGESGGKDSRPALDEMMSRLGEVDVIVFWKVDRLARSVGTFDRLRRETDAAGVALVSATEPLDFTTPMGRAMGSIIATFAELERDVIGSRVSASIAKLAELGRWRGGTPPLGYRPEALPGGGFRLAEDPEDGPRVRRAVEAVLAGASVSRAAQAEGIIPATFTRLLRNPSLWGAVIYQGEVVKDSDGMPLTPHDALVSRADFLRLQEVLAARATPTERVRSDSPLLAGVAYCASCKAALHGQRSQKRGTSFLTCSTKHRGNGRTCPGVSISEGRLTDYVVGRFLDDLGHLEMVEAVEVGGQAAELAADLDEARHALEDLEADRYDRGLFSGTKGAERFAGIHARLTERIEALEAQAAAAPAAGVEMRPTGETFGQVWERSDTEERRGLLRRALRVEVTKGRGTVESRAAIRYTS
jgi:site-specific DNA recombinase